MSQESDLALRRKSDPVKMDLARILRPETTLPLKWISARLEMASRKSINRRLYEQSTSGALHLHEPLGEPE